MTGERGVVRVYRTLIGLYPRQFRNAYGADMVQLLSDQCSDEPAWRVSGRAVVDLAITIPFQHLEARMNRTPNHLVPLVYSAIATAGVLFAVVGGTNVTMLIVGACIAVVASAMAAIAWRRTGPIGGAVSTEGWWKLVVAGPCIIVGVIVAAGLGVEAWFLGVILVFGAFVVTGVGLVLGLVRLSNRHSRTLST